MIGVSIALAAISRGGMRMIGIRALRWFLASVGWILCAAVVAGVGLQPSPADAAGVRPLFDLSHPAGGPFPSNRFTVRDLSQNTGLRINLPQPDCTVRITDCQQIALLNELDGFNLQ